MSELFRGVIRASESTVIPVVLLAMEHPDWPQIYRYCSLSEPFDSNGETFYPGYFEIELPDQAEGRASRCQLTMLGVTLEVERNLLSVRSNPKVGIEIVRYDAPDEIEMSFPDMTVQAVEIVSGAVTIQLVQEAVGSQKATEPDFSPAYFPGLF